MLSDCEGKDVRGAEGHKVGKVVRCEGSDLVIQAGVFRVDTFTISSDEVASITGQDLYLRRPARHYRPEAFGSGAWSPWHSGRRDAAGREDMEELKRADREARLGAQGLGSLSEQARTSCPEGDVGEHEREDRLGHLASDRDQEPPRPEEPRGSPPEARLPPMPHPEDEPWP